MKIELYIDKQLCDVGDPKKFSVTLKRQLYNPSELNTKDAQASYTITLPASNTNNRIFGHANVEEVKGKFERLYDAELIVNGIRIFEGKFKLSEIDSYSYKGNLGIPAPKTAKDIFGEKKMNEMGEWELLFKGVPDLETKEIINLEGLDFITYYNNLPDSPCIFPFVLYGLLPKVTKKDGTYSDKEVFDETVRLGIEDFPPSVNCMQMLKYLFRKAGYRLTGTALSDEKLNKLYVSYKNPNNYTQEWNWGDLATIDIKGSWSMADRKEPYKYEMYERCIDQNTDDYGEYFSVNLFNSNRLQVDSISDTGTNVQYSEYLDDYSDNDLKKYTRKSLHVVIPRSGYYKVRLKCDSFKLDDTSAFIGKPSDMNFANVVFHDSEMGNKFTLANQSTSYNNTFARSRYEIQVLRDYGEGDFHNTNVVGWFSKPQFPQSPFMKRSTDKDQYPKYYPVPGGPIVVDPGVNQNFICGLHWGEHGKPDHDGDSKEWNPRDWPDYGGKRLMSYYMFIANGFSWDKTFSQKTKILSVYDSSYYDPETGRNKNGNYLCFGVEGDGDNEENEGDEDIKPEWLDKLVEQRYAILDCGEHDPDNPGSYPCGDHKNSATQTGPSKDKYWNMEGKGEVENIIWLEKGERLTVGIAADMGDRYHSYDQWLIMIENVKFDLHIEPFRTDILWSNFDNRGNYNKDKLLNWNDKITFETEKIDLAKFLPSEQKIDDWVDNFCKAFNLNLVSDEGNTYRLDVKQKNLISESNYLIDLDNRAHVVHRTNQSLGLPRKYELGFSVNADEEGYYRPLQEKNEAGEKKLDSGYKGGGIFDTGSHDTDEISQTSNFSYCWYKTLTDHLEEEKGELTVPVISGHEIWDNPAEEDYREMLRKQYFDKAQRFWYKYKNHLLNLGNPPIEGKSQVADAKQRLVEAALVSGEYKEGGKLILDYGDKPDSIMRNYFFLLDNSYNYTEIECILTPEEYNGLTHSLAKLNGDLYNIVSVDGYDPACRKPAKLKMIRKTQ